MKLETRLIRFLAQLSKNLKEKLSFFQMKFSSAIFFLFSGFVAGNLFGTFLPAIRVLIPWDGFILVIFLFFVEIVTYIRYQSEGRFFLLLWQFPFSYKKRVLWKNFNFLKIGLLLGFFIDAFKVGS